MNEVYKKYLYIALAVVLLVCTVYLFSSRDHDTGAGQTRDNLSTVGEQQQRAEQEVRESQRLTETIRESNQSAIREIEASRADNQSSASLIAEGQRILRQVRERNDSKGK